MSVHASKSSSLSPVSSSQASSSLQSSQSSVASHLPKPLRYWQQTLAVFCGGLIGTAFRALLSSFQPSSAVWPWATFLINCVGAFLLGFLFEYLAATGEDRGIRQAVRLCCGTGMLGAFTTYGTFILETEQRMTSGQARTVIIGVGYALISVIGGLFLAGLGVSIARVIAQRTHPVHFQRRERLKKQKAHAEARSRRVILAASSAASASRQEDQR